MTMAGLDKQGPWVRDGRQSGFRDEADISGLTIRAGEHLQEGFHLFRTCVFIELPEFQLTDVPFKAGGGKVVFAQAVVNQAGTTAIESDVESPAGRLMMDRT